MINRAFIFFILTYFLVTEANSQRPISLAADQFQYPISTFYYFHDVGSKLTINDVLDSSKISEFDFYSSQDSVTINPNDTYWLKLELENKSGRDNSWVLNFENWSYVDFYLIQDNSDFVHKQTGHLIPFDERDYAVANRSYILIDLERGDLKTCIIRLRPIKNLEMTPEDLTFKVSSQKLSDKADYKFGAIIMLFTGVYLVMFFYNLFVYFSIREKAYLTYLIIVFLGLYMNLQYSGFQFQIFKFNGAISILNIFGKLNYNLFGIVLLLFIHDFFNIKVRYPKWYKFNFILILAMIIADIVIFVDFDTGIAITGPLNLLLAVVVITLAVKSIKDKYPSSSYFLIGYIFFWVFATIKILATLGVIPKTDFTWSFSVPFGQIAEMVFFSFALTNKINVLQETNQKNQEKIVAQLSKNAELKTMVNRELEEKVVERTKEISLQKEHISEQSQALEAEIKKSDKLLLNILPPSTANELKTRGFAEPKHYENVSVLFADFMGFTRIAENLSPSKLLHELDYCFSAFDQIITKYNLEKIKTMGDSYMCAGGLPLENDSHAIDTVKAGIAFQDFIQDWKLMREKTGEQAWDLRVGIHSGPVTAGVVGKIKFAYDIWGDTVNLANRMESAGEIGKVNISQSTYELVSDSYNCDFRGNVSIKNKGEARMYFVNGQKTSEA